MEVSGNVRFPVILTLATVPALSWDISTVLREGRGLFYVALI
jgi:hypothetical protein